MCPRAQPLVGRGAGSGPPPKNNWTTQPLRSFLVGVTDCANVGVLFYKNFWRRAVIPQTKNWTPNFENVVAPSAPVPATSCLRWVDGDLR